MAIFTVVISRSGGETLFPREKIFFRLHSGIRALLCGSLVALCAVATGGEVLPTSSPPPSDPLLEQLSVLQTTIDQAAETVGVMPILPSTSNQGEPTATIAAPKPSAGTGGEKAESSTPAATKPGSGAIITGSKTASGSGIRTPSDTGEVNAAVPTAELDEGRESGNSNSPTINLPTVSDVGNLNQVVTTLGPLTGNSDAISPFRPAGIGSESIIMPKASFSRDPLVGERSGDVLPLNQPRVGATFGAMRTFTMARADGNPDSPDSASLGDDPTDKNGNGKKAGKDKDKDGKPDNQNQVDPQFQKQAEDKLNHTPFTQQDYDDFKKFVNQNFGKVQQLVNSQPDFGNKVVSTFDQFAPNPPQNDDLPVKRLVDGVKRQRDDDFQPQLAPVSHDSGTDPTDGTGTESGEGSGTERSRAPSDGTTTH